MTYVVEVLRQEHRNIEKLLRVLEQELSVFDRGSRPDYEAVLGVIDYFKDYPDSCHHPKEDMIFEKLKSRDPVAAANIGDLEIEHQEGASSASTSRPGGRASTKRRRSYSSDRGRDHS